MEELRLTMNPLHQFEIHKLFSCSLGRLDISFTNTSLFMVLVTATICLLLHLGTRSRRLVPSKGQFVCEELFRFAASLLSDNVGKDGVRYLPYVLSLFLFILGTNLMGLVPHSFTVTSHLAVTLTLALIVFFGTSLAGFLRNGRQFFRVFCPEGTPPLLRPLLVPIEVTSYMLRPISLGLRLCINMIAGHIILKLLAGAAPACLDIPVLKEIGPVLVVMAGVVMLAFEVFVSCLQTYIFTLFGCIYLNGTIHPE